MIDVSAFCIIRVEFVSTLREALSSTVNVMAVLCVGTLSFTHNIKRSVIATKDYC